LAPRAKKT